MYSSSEFFWPSDDFEPGIPANDAFIGGHAVMPLLVNVSSLAAMLAVSRRTIYRLVEHGELPPPLHVGRLARWRVVDVVAFVDLLREQEALSTANLWESAQWIPNYGRGDQEKQPN